LESFLISAVLGVRCDLSIDYSAIRQFARDGDVTQLLLFVDQSAERSAHCPISDIVLIVTSYGI
jgi:spatacsin